MATEEGDRGRLARLTGHVEGHLRDEVIDLALDRVEASRQSGKQPNFRNHAQWAESEVRARPSHRSRSDSATDLQAGELAGFELSAQSRLQVETAQVLKARFGKLSGIPWSEALGADLQTMLDWARHDARSDAEKRAVKIAKALRSAVADLRELASEDGAGGVVWAYLVGEIEPALCLEPIDTLLKTTDPELAIASTMAADESGLTTPEARFAAIYLRHRGARQAGVRAPEGDPTFQLPWSEVGQIPLPEKDAVREVAVAYLLAGLTEDVQPGADDGPVIPVEWSTWPDVELPCTPEGVLTRTVDQFKGPRGPYRRAIEAMKKARPGK